MPVPRLNPVPDDVRETAELSEVAQRSAQRREAEAAAAAARRANAARAAQEARSQPNSSGTGGTASNQRQQRASTDSSSRAEANYGRVVRSRIAGSFRGRAQLSAAVATVSVTISSAGRITGVSLLRSSGDREVDAAALDAVRSARYPSFPPDISRPSLTFTVPLRVQ
ncbi:TonB family protein [Acuticoccus sp. M5D2P5]|nr:TonB family protein [Acuticoccus kalidii]